MTELDGDRLKERYAHLFGKVDGAFTCVLGYLGDRLGLYAGLAEHGACTSEQLAERTGLHERWVREWLHQQAAAGVVRHDAGRFSLDDESAEIYGRKESGVFGAGLFELVLGLIGTADRLEESFRTGLGETYDALGPMTSRGVERTCAPFFRARLVSEALPALDGVVERLERGAKVADVGCGGGVALEEMARAFPASEFHGFDNSRAALGRAEDRAAALENLTIHDTTHRRLPEDESFDLITTFDCIHDMTHPVETVAAIRRSLKPDGTWFVADVHGHPTLEENVAEKPISAMFYGFSVLCCMRAALSTRDGAGLGTLGFHEAVARRMAEEAGFSRFVKHDFDNPINDYYEIRI